MILGNPRTQQLHEDPKPAFNSFRVDHLKTCMKLNGLVVGKDGRKADMVTKCSKRCDDLHPISCGPKIDQETEKVTKNAVELGLVKPKGKSTVVSGGPSESTSSNRSRSTPTGEKVRDTKLILLERRIEEEVSKPPLLQSRWK